MSGLIGHLTKAAVAAIIGAVTAPFALVFVMFLFGDDGWGILFGIILFVTSLIWAPACAFVAAALLSWPARHLIAGYPSRAVPALVAIGGLAGCAIGVFADQYAQMDLLPAPYGAGFGAVTGFVLACLLWLIPPPGAPERDFD